MRAVGMIKRVFLASALLLAAVGAYADPVRQDDLNWLKAMAFAAHQTDYSGTFVYQYSGHVETMRITHVVDRDGEHGKLESLDGPRREVIRHNDQVWCYVGNDKVKMGGHGERAFPALLPQQLSLLNENYRVRPAEEGRLAGFHAHAIVFQPRDNLRYLRKMWADSNSGLLLKSETQDEHGNVVEQYSFTQLSIGGDIDRKWIAEPPPVGGASNPARIADAHHGGEPQLPGTLPGVTTVPVDSGWKVDAMPPGFRKVAEVRRQLRGKDIPVIQMTYSDGLAGISVFIEKTDSDEDDHQGLISRGMTQVYSKVADGYLVTVVGEVPPGTVMQVADSVRNGSGN